MNTGEAVRLTLIVLAGIQSWNAVLCNNMGTKDQFLDWLQTHSNNENAVYEYTHGNEQNVGELYDRNVLISQLIPDVIRDLEHYRYALEGARNQMPLPSTSFGKAKRGYKKRNFAWQPMGGPLPVETRLVAFGSKLGPGVGDASGSSNKAMRYGR